MIDINYILKHLDITKTFIIFILSSGIIQISPIKINPYSKFVKWIGDVACASTREDINKLFDKIDRVEVKQAETESKLNTSITILQTNLSNIEKVNKENEIKNIRRQILLFYEDLRSGEDKPLDSFHSILADIDEYKKYCEENPDFKNGYTTNAVEIIRQKALLEMKQ